MRGNNFSILYIGDNIPGAQGFLLAAWHKIKSGKLTQKLFYDGSINNADEFIRDIWRKGSLVFLVMCNGELAAMSWLNTITGKIARTHFVIFRKFWGKTLHREIGVNLYSYILTRKDQQGYLFDCLYGITPKSNALAWKAAINCGWQRVGELPNACFMAAKNESEAGIITCATREILGIRDNEERRSRWAS